ncbi:MAG: diguanylate cyclase [Nitrospirae bacterium]|nr:diguanylate cyclase [Nitrospirota bacterium]
MKAKTEKSIFWKYTVFICAALLIGLTVILTVVYLNSDSLIYQQALKQARLLFHSVSLVKKWNSGYGGVFVLKSPDIEANPYLATPDIVTFDGKVYTEKNPALMAREISLLAQKDGFFTYHITGAHFAHPDSRPDAFETASLARFDSGERESYGAEQKDGRTLFRYMAPLYIEHSCMTCHEKWGFREGQIHGGISVSFEIDDIRSIQRLNRMLFLSTGIFGLVILSSGIALFAKKLFRGISEERKAVETMAMTDELTGLYNRRHLLARFSEEMERVKRVGSHLCCIMGDIDHFKSINDELGHPTGDRVLQETALLMRRELRPYDLLGRFGGEEFLVVLPNTDVEEAGKLAERLRKIIREQLAENANLPEGRAVTMSIGITCFHGTDRTVDDVIKRADENLYRAKAKGRDRVEAEMV